MTLMKFESHISFMPNDPNDIIPILCGNDISFCYFFALGMVRGLHFCVKLKMCGH